MPGVEPAGGEWPGLWLVLPCYRVTAQILQVLAEVPDWVEGVICVDDACPEGSGRLITASIRDPRVLVLTLPRNQGVGGAVLAGYREALRRGARIIVKADGDGQMDLRQLARLVGPIRLGRADYAKGNRFTQARHLARMPPLRLLANLLLSVAAKAASGYWGIFDAANGFTAIEVRVAQRLLEEPVARGYFFETDMLCRLGALRAVVRDVPIPARYGQEQSNLCLRAALLPFAGGLLRHTGRRLRRRYFVREVPAATLEFAAGAVLLAAGTAWAWAAQGNAVPGAGPWSGTASMAAVPVLAGIALLLLALRRDIRAVPTEPIHPGLRGVAIEPHQRVGEGRPEPCPARAGGVGPDVGRESGRPAA